jgi:hypothetical protein
MSNNETRGDAIFWLGGSLGGVAHSVVNYVSPFWALTYSVPRRRLFMADYWAYRLED